jgi:hypothetical protein
MTGLLHFVASAALIAVSVLLLISLPLFLLKVFAARSGLMPMCASQHLPATIRFPYRVKDSAVFEWLARTLPADQADGSVVFLTRVANLKAFFPIRTCGEAV